MNLVSVTFNVTSIAHSDHCSMTLVELMVKHKGFYITFCLFLNANTPTLVVKGLTHLIERARESRQVSSKR